jgi:hypothetical protein
VCRNQWNVEYQRRRRDDPGWLERRRESQAKYAYKKYKKAMADPKLHALYLQEKRMFYALAQERKGKPPNRHYTFYPLPEEEDVFVPVDPFLSLLRNGAGELLDPSHLKRILGGEQKAIRLSTADMICTRLSLPLSAYLPDRLTHSVD